MTAPLQVELRVYPGTTFQREFRWLPDGDDPQDFTGWSAVFLVGAPRTRATWTSTSAPGGEVTLGPDGTVTVSLDAEKTAAMWPGSYGYVLDLRAPDGTVTRLLRGRLVVVSDVGATAWAT